MNNPPNPNDFPVEFRDLFIEISLVSQVSLAEMDAFLPPPLPEEHQHTAPLPIFMRKLFYFVSVLDSRRRQAVERNDVKTVVDSDAKVALLMQMMQYHVQQVPVPEGLKDVPILAWRICKDFVLSFRERKVVTVRFDSPQDDLSETDFFDEEEDDLDEDPPPPPTKKFLN